MKTPSLDKRIVAATPAHTLADHNFTNKVMARIDTQLPRQTPFIRILHMPKYALALYVILVLTLCGGTTYAIYKALWAQPSVSIGAESTNTYGRKQLDASLTNCGNQTAEVTFEIKAGATLDKSEIQNILQARCEMSAIQNWAGENDRVANADQKPKLGTSQSSSVMVYPTVGEVAAISKNQLALTGDGHLPDSPLELDSATQYIANGEYTTQDKIRPGDNVLFVQNITTRETTTKDERGDYTTSGVPTHKQITHVIKLNLPFAYYNADKQNLLAQRKACVGNPSDSCLQSSSIDLYTSTSLGQSTASAALHTIQGVVTKQHDKTITLQSSSGRTITVELPHDIVADFNTNRSSLYDNMTVGTGNILQVNYFTADTHAQNTILPSSVLSVQLILNPVAHKTDTLQKY